MTQKHVTSNYVRPGLMLGIDTDYIQNMLKQMEEKVNKKPEPFKVDVYKWCLAFSLDTKSEYIIKILFHFVPQMSHQIDMTLSFFLSDIY